MRIISELQNVCTKIWPKCGQNIYDICTVLVIVFGFKVKLVVDPQYT